MALKDHVFSSDELRRFNPKYIYNAFTNTDIAEIKNFIQYSRGLVIKDNEVAEEFETSASLKSSAIFMAAMDKVILGTAVPYETQSIVKTYKEQNPYYLGLQANFGIDPYTARKTKDYHIIKSTFQTLDTRNKQIYEEAYYESLNYYLKVTKTDAFNNQEYKREVMNLILIFMTFHRYINKTMNGYFNVDTYDAKKLKNSFISYGVDYFERFPLNYQRRILKQLNDLIRNKGTDTIFDIITNVFSFSGLKINKYELVKKTDDYGKNSVEFYQTPYNEKLDVSTNPIIPFEDLTKDDPYWRSDENETSTLMNRINVSATKYISVDIIVDIIKNSQQMSFFVSLLNLIHRTNKHSIELYAEENNVSLQEATIQASTEDLDFSFSNKNISDKPVNIFNAVVALYVLILKKMNWTDTIHRVNKVKSVYGYNTDNDVHDILLKARIWLIQNRHMYTDREYISLMNFSSTFNIKGFNLPAKCDFEHVLELYNSNFVYSSQAKIIAEKVQSLINSDKMIVHLENDNLYDALEFLSNTVLDSGRNLELSFLNKFKDFQKVLALFIELEVNTGYIDEDRIYSFLINNISLQQELISYIASINDINLNNVLKKYISNSSIDNIKLLINSLDKTIRTLFEKGEYTDDNQLDRYENLSVFLNSFLSYRDSLNKTKFTLEDFTGIFLYNENNRKKLEDYILNLDSPYLVERFKEIWNLKFKTDYDMELFKQSNSFSDYLKQNDASLYYYTQIETTPQNAGTIDLQEIYKNKIFELIDSIDNQLFLGNDYDFWLQNSFVGLSGYIKQYTYILIRAFKAYTVDTVYTADDFTFNDLFDNSFHLTDEVIIRSLGKLGLQDYIDLQDTTEWNYKVKLKDDSIKLTDKINITITKE